MEGKVGERSGVGTGVRGRLGLGRGIGRGLGLGVKVQGWLGLEGEEGRR